MRMPAWKHSRRYSTVGSALAAGLTLVACTSSPHQQAVSSATTSAEISASGTSVGASSPSSKPPTSAPIPTAIWPTYHHDAARSGFATGVAAVTGLRVETAAALDAAIYASPLVVHDAAGDLVIAATENNTVYGLRDNGSVVWKQHLGTPVNGASLPCGDIDPTGITGTPVYDPSSGLVYVVAFLSGDKHELVALNAETGVVRFTRGVDPVGSHPNVEQERGALLLADGRVWVPYGGLDGDCGPYHGYLVGVPTSGLGNAATYQVPSSREAGIWTPAGAAADTAGHLYISVGNGAQENPKAPYDMSDSLIELDGSANSTSMKVLSFFAPSSWASENASDLDLGTTGPVILPTGQVFIAGKAGTAYLLRQGSLGGLGGAVPNIRLCTAFGGAAYSNGTMFLPCTNGVRAVKISGTTMTPSWHAAATGSPIVGGGVVLSVDPKAGTLYALDPGSGAVRFVIGLGGPTTRFATPAMSDGHVYVGTQSGRLVIIATS